MSKPPDGQRQRGVILAAILRLARGDASGVNGFGDTTRAFVHSLIPLLALPVLVASGTMIAGHLTRGLADLLASVCALLLPAVVSHAFARLWDREALWARYAVAFNWCQFALSLLGMVVLLLLGALSDGGPPQAASDGAVIVLVVACLGLMAYGLWLPWFVARAGLQITGGRAAMLVAAVYGSTFAVLLGRGLLYMDRG